MKNVVMLTMVFYSFLAKAQTRNINWGNWGWLKLSKQVSKRQTVGFQYQVRYSDGFSTFDRSNIYVTYSLDLKRKWNFDALYQWNANREMDQHTFFVAFSKKMNWKKCSLTYRTAIQHIENTHNIPALGYVPYTEWRNRLRLKIPLSKHWSSSWSYEPYLMFTNRWIPALTRARFVADLSRDLNKYTSFSVFYLSQPAYKNIGQPSWKNVLGLTFQIELPRSHKSILKVFDYTHKKSSDSKTN